MSEKMKEVVSFFFYAFLYFHVLDTFLWKFFFTFSSDLCLSWHNVFSAIFPALLSSQNSHIITQKKVKQRYPALIWDVRINTGEIKVRSSMQKEASMVILQKLEIFPLVLIPVADMLQGHLIGILMASLCLHMPLIHTGDVFGLNHFSARWAFCTNRSP